MNCFRYFNRYLQGEHEAVWGELLSLGANYRQEETFADARAVALETMYRVRVNINTIISRLEKINYQFDHYPDGTLIPFNFGPTLEPNSDLIRQVNELEDLVGAIPLSLRAFWEVVGGVSLIGRTPGGWLNYSDPLVVEPPDLCIAQYREWQAYDEEDKTNDPYVAAIAPDIFHKDNVSGGGPYGFSLPNNVIDGVLLYEEHNLYFVSYLRFALLEWGGFPGLCSRLIKEEWRNSDSSKINEWITELRNDLVAF